MTEYTRFNKVLAVQGSNGGRIIKTIDVPSGLVSDCQTAREAAVKSGFEDGTWFEVEMPNHDLWYAEALAAEKAGMVYVGGNTYEDKQDVNS